jgi:hypothetical protein
MELISRRVALKSAVALFVLSEEFRHAARAVFGIVAASGVPCAAQLLEC